MDMIKEKDGDRGDWGPCNLSRCEKLLFIHLAKRIDRMMNIRADFRIEIARTEVAKTSFTLSLHIFQTVFPVETISPSTRPSQTIYTFITKFLIIL